MADRDLSLNPDDYFDLPRVTPSGDRALVTGDPLIEAWTERAALTSPGELLDAPEFGGGVPSYLHTLGSPSRLAALAAQVKATWLSDSRFAAASVTIRVDRDNPTRVVLDRVLTLADNTTVTVRE